MNRKHYAIGSLILAAVVAPVVIGVFGGELAGLLRIEALFGLGVVATLVALIILEYRTSGIQANRQATVGSYRNDVIVARQPGQVVTLPVRDERAAA